MTIAEIAARICALDPADDAELARLVREMIETERSIHGGTFDAAGRRLARIIEAELERRGHPVPQEKRA